MLTYGSELAREKMWARIYLIPALQAEEDRDQVRRYLADKAREKELLGSETKIYNSDRYNHEASVHVTVELMRWLQVRSTNLRSHPRERDEVKDEVRNGSIGVRDVHTIVREAGNEEGSNGPATGSSNAISLIHHASLLRGTCSGACSWSQFLDFKP